MESTYFDNVYMWALYLLLMLFWIIYLYFVKNYGYWEELKIPHVPAVFPMGSLGWSLIFANTKVVLSYDRVYKQFCGERFCGIIEVRSPCLIVRDPDLVRHIVTADSDHFQDRTVFVYNPKEYMMKCVYTRRGDEWREMRKIVAPVFNKANIESLHFTLVKCSSLLKKHMKDMLQNSNIISVRDLITFYSIDVTSYSFFAQDFDPSVCDMTEFYTKVPSIFAWDVATVRNLYIINAFPIFRTIYFNKFCVFNPGVRDYLSKIIFEIIEDREKNHLVRYDFLDMFIKIRQHKKILEDEKSSEHNRSRKIESITPENIAGEFMGFLAGNMKAASTIMFCLYELSRHPEIQETLFKEMWDLLTRHNGKLTYQAILEMKYLDKVVLETLRLYPPLPVLQRSCTKNYQVPDSKLKIEKDVRLVIPVYSLHHDPEYFPDPKRFDPERFTPAKMTKRHPYSFLPFGEGSRGCLGSHYGLMQTKIGIATIISDFKVSLAPETKIPLRFQEDTFIIYPKDSFPLTFQRRQ